MPLEQSFQFEIRRFPERIRQNDMISFINNIHLSCRRSRPFLREYRSSRPTEESAKISLERECNTNLLCMPVTFEGKPRIGLFSIRLSHLDDFHFN